jgi:phosphatidylglycerophosphate synthase
VLRRSIPWLLVATRAVVGPGVGIVLIRGGSTILGAILLAIGLLTDLLDGVLARRFSVSTTRLRAVDSWIDTWFYVWIIGAVFVTHFDQIWPLRVPLLAVVATQIITWAVDWIKFGRFSTYHALMAKIWGPVIAVALMTLVVFDYSELIIIAIVWGVLSHAETTAITLTLPAYQDDVLTVPRAWRVRQRSLERE